MKGVTHSPFRWLSMVMGFMLLVVTATGYSQESRPTFIISDVIVEGNANVDETLIRSVATLKKGNLFNLRSVSTTIKQIYHLGLFEDIRVFATKQDNNAIELMISVKEYPLLDHVEFEGNKKIKTKNLERELAIYQGQAVSPYRRKVNIDRLLKMYRGKGYLLAKVDDQVLVTQNVATLRMTIDEGKKVKLGDIFVEGNDNLKYKKIKKAIKKKAEHEEEHFWKEGDLRRERLLDTFEKVAKEYRKNGFRMAKVVSDSLWFSENKERMHLKIKVLEGPQSYMGKLEFDGNTIFTDEQLERTFSLNEGDVFNDEEYNKSLGKMYEAYGERGYLYANPFPQESSRGDTIDIRVSLNEGTPAKVHRVHIIGNTKTKDKVIRREMLIKPGQIFQRSALVRSQRDIFQLNFFQDVVPDIQPLQNGDVDVTIQVQEKPTGTANAGAGYSGLDGLIGTISLVIPNFLGNGQTVNFAWEFGARRNSVSMGFVEPWLFDTPTSAGIDLFRTVRFWFGEFRIRETGFGLSSGRRIRNSYFRIQGGYRLADLRYTDFRGPYHPGFVDEGGNPAADPALVQQREELLENSGITSSVSNAIIRDSRNFPIFATSGSRNAIQTVVAGLGGKVKYIRQNYTSDWYVPVFGGTALSLKGKYGYVSNPFNSRDVPFNERFFPGGVSFDGMIRGYSNNSVGPHIPILDASGNIVSSVQSGGVSMAIFTAEYQIPIVDQRKSTSPVYGLLFLEAGNAWEKVSQTSFSPASLKKSAGFGIRVVMPLVGVMGFDFGYGFDPPSDPLFSTKRRNGWNTHFQLGQVF